MDLSRLNKFLSITILTAILAVPATSFAIAQKGKQAPPIRVVTTSGQKVSLANYKGYVLVMEFFATWCEGCKESLPHLINYNKQYGKQGLQILGLNPGVRGDSVDVVRQFMKEKQINFPVALVDDDLLLDYGISPIPAIFIIDRKGILVQKFLGFNSDIQKEMESTIKSLLAQ